MDPIPPPAGLPADRAFPSFRYVPWDLLDDGASTAAPEELGYDRTTWDFPGTAEIEALSWNSSEAAASVWDGAASLGWDEASWDCYANHFGYYGWDDLADEGVQDYFAALGWTGQAWDGNSTDMPETEDMYWADLTPEQRAAAGSLCYFNYTWDMELSLPEWHYWRTEALSSSSSPPTTMPLPDGPTQPLTSAAMTISAAAATMHFIFVLLGFFIRQSI